MSSETLRTNRSKRLKNTWKNIKKQLRIAKPNYDFEDFIDISLEPHRFAKKKSMNCGNPKCFLCANPRKIWKERTIQERKNYLKDIEYFK